MKKKINKINNPICTTLQLFNHLYSIFSLGFFKKYFKIVFFLGGGVGDVLKHKIILQSYANLWQFKPMELDCNKSAQDCTK